MHRGLRNIRRTGKAKTINSKNKELAFPIFVIKVSVFITISEIVLYKWL